MMDFKKLFLEKREGDFALAVVFLVIGIVLAGVGFVRDEGVWYVRTGIFWIAAWFVWWRSR